jgi:chromosome partitioning protein
MPTVVAVLNQKGGSGKTTIATNHPHALHRQNQRVLLVDADPQGSARDWHEANGGTLLPVIGLDRETLPKDLAAVSRGYEWIVIDGAPQVVKMSAAAVKAADIVLIPVQPSPYDIWACGDLVDIIKARQDMTGGKPRAAFVVSRVIKNSRLSGEVTAALADYGLPVFKSLTTQRVLYPTTAATGHSVFSTSKNGAAGEINAIKDELMEFANA